MDREEINKLVQAILDNKVFLSILLHNKPEMIPRVFLPIAMGAFNQLTKRQMRHLTCIYSYRDKALPSTADGYPIFGEAYLVYDGDWDIVERLVREATKDRGLVNVIDG